MSDVVAVIKIMDTRAKYGKSQKTGKDWSMSYVELNNGESAYIFNPIEIGDVVESVQNGEFKNWQKQKAPDPKHKELLDRLDRIIKILTNDTVVVPEDDIAGLEPPEGY